MTYAVELSEDYIHDIGIESKLIKKANNKSKKLLKKAAEHYKTVFGKEPKIYKKIGDHDEENEKRCYVRINRQIYSGSELLLEIKNSMVAGMSKG